MCEIIDIGMESQCLLGNGRKRGDEDLDVSPDDDSTVRKGGLPFFCLGRWRRLGVSSAFGRKF